MDKFRVITVFAFWFLVLSHGFVVVFGDGDYEHTNDMHEEQTAKRILQDSYSLLTKTSERYWVRVKNLINQLQINFYPPNLDFRSDASDGGEEGHSTAGEKVTEAAGKSFKTSKVAVEESAKSAAEAVGKAVHKTAEKVKGTSASTDDDSHEEL